MCCRKCASNINENEKYSPVCGKNLSVEKMSSAELLKLVFCDDSAEKPRKRFGFFGLASILEH